MPPEIGQLKNLQVLEINNNQLLRLPSEFGQLENLHWLHLEENPLAALPLEMAQLSRLYTFSAPPLTFPPLEIQQQGMPAIRAYLRDYEAMLIRQAVVVFAVGIGGIAGLILAFRWWQRRGLHGKMKRA